MPTLKKRVDGFSGKKVVEGYHVSISLFSSWTTNYQKLNKNYCSPVIQRFLSTLPYKPEALALSHIKSQKPTTSEIINSLLLNQKVSITREELYKLLNISFVEFKLPLDSNSQLAFTKLVGRPNSRGKYAGVYVFTHTETCQMYVGSSNMLGRRLSQYLDPKKGFMNKKDNGLLLPLIKKEGFSKFTLKIYVMPANSNISYDFLFLEQYFLLDSKFTLNTQRIVNFRVDQGTTIYIYNANYSILYHTSLSFNALKQEIGIHYSNIKSSIETGELFLNTFRITSKFYPDAIKSDMSLLELNNFISLKRKEKLLNNGAQSIYLYNKDLTILYYMSNSQRALHSALGISADSVRNCLKTGSLYLDFFAIKWELVPGISYTSISLDLEKLNILLLKKRKEYKLKYLKKGFGYGNIAISVLCNESGLVKDFPSISAACAYLKSEGSIINPTTITKYLDSGKLYKGFIFKKKED